MRNKKPVKKSPKPIVTVIDWKSGPVVNGDTSVEREVLGNTAEVRYALCDDEADFNKDICESDVILLWQNANVTEDGISRLKKCRTIVRNGVGYDSVDIAAAGRAGISVCNVPDYGTEEVADHAIALTLALTRQLFPLDAEAKSLGWKLHTAHKIRRLRELTFAIVGLGRIGTAVALRAKALGLQVVFYDPYVSNGVEKAIGIRRVRSLDVLLKQADVLTLHTPLTAETRYLIGARELALMKPTAYVVNTSRGPVIEKRAIFDALRKGKLWGAALDVVEDEPLRTKEEAATPNLIVTCHAAFCSVEAKEEMRRTAARITRQAVLFEPLDNLVNGQFLRK